LFGSKPWGGSPFWEVFGTQPFYPKVGACGLIWLGPREKNFFPKKLSHFWGNPFLFPWEGLKLPQFPGFNHHLGLKKTFWFYHFWALGRFKGIVPFLEGRFQNFGFWVSQGFGVLLRPFKGFISLFSSF